MKHKKLTIIMTCLVFAMICVLCLKELFTVRDINVEHSVSDIKNIESVSEILEKYKGRNIFFINTRKIRDEITAQRKLKVVSVKKNFPNELLVKLVERNEKFCYVAQESGSVYYFDEEYFIVREEKTSTPDCGGHLIELDFNDIDGNKVEPKSCEVLKTFRVPQNPVWEKDRDLNKQIDCCLDSFEKSDNVVKIGFLYKPDGGYAIIFFMREGVRIEFSDAANRLDEKARAGKDMYLTLSEREKIGGKIIVNEQSSPDRKIKATYTLH